MTDDELLAAVLRRILHDPERHEAHDPFVVLGENELLIDGRVPVSDAESEALLRVRAGDPETP